MKTILLILTVLTSITYFSQIEYWVKKDYKDLIIKDSSYYLLNPSPSRFNNRNLLDKTEITTAFNAVYIIRNDSLFFERFLSYTDQLSKKKKHFIDSICVPYKGDFIKYSATFDLIELDNPNRIEKLIKNNVFYFNYYDVKTTKVNIVNGVHTNNQTHPSYGTLSLKIPWHEKSYINNNNLPIEYSGDFTIVTIQNDEIVFQGRIEHYVDKERIELSENIYKIKYRLNNEDYFWIIDIKNNQNTSVDLDYFHCNVSNDIIPYYELDNEEGKPRKYKETVPSSIDIHINYGNKHLLSSSSIDVQSYEAGFKQYFSKDIGYKYITSLDLLYGFNFSQNFIQNDTSLVGIENLKYHSYNNFNAIIGVSNRYYLSRYKGSSSHRLFLELGGYYNFPLFFRYITKVGDSKYSEKHINNFKNINLHSKLGIFNGLALTVDYRIFDVVKRFETQLPKLRIGLSFTFSNY